MGSLAIGIMSGTSLDGADAVLADFSGASPRSIATAFIPFSQDLKSRLLRLCVPGNDGLDDAGACSVELAAVYASAAKRVLDESGLRPSDVRVIGCHGQTVRHRPDLGFTLQLNDPALVAERTGIDVSADFRRRDMAAGGQGAPLVPLFHDAVFRHETLHRAIVNLGGIANITSLCPGRIVSGFDCGPGNVLMDGWTTRHLGEDFDEDGRWAARGTVNARLLRTFLAEPFLALEPPKSTGRELFNEAWLRTRLDGRIDPQDVQATLLEFTAVCVVGALDRFCDSTDEVYLCGGGARNRKLASRIGELTSPRPVRLTDDLGVAAAQVEAMAFAWLALKCVRREPLDLSTITGATHPCILGAIYPS
ncbi:MAG: anhydro-N-acetylmuramic acid kinase [Burkholderiales bacterium]